MSQSKGGRPSKYHFDMLLKVEQPGVGHFYGAVDNIRSAVQQWAKSRGAKIKTRVLQDDRGPFLEVIVKEVPESAPF